MLLCHLAQQVRVLRRALTLRGELQPEAAERVSFCLAELWGWASGFKTEEKNPVMEKQLQHGIKSAVRVYQCVSLKDCNMGKMRSREQQTFKMLYTSK